MYVSYALLSFHLILEWILEGSETSKTLRTVESRLDYGDFGIG